MPVSSKDGNIARFQFRCEQEMMEKAKKLADKYRYSMNAVFYVLLDDAIAKDKLPPPIPKSNPQPTNGN